MDVVVHSEDNTREIPRSWRRRATSGYTTHAGADNNSGHVDKGTKDETDLVKNTAVDTDVLSTQVTLLGGQYV